MQIWGFRFRKISEHDVKISNFNAFLIDNYQELSTIEIEKY